MSDAVTSCRVRRGDRHDTETLTLTDASQANPEVKASLTGRCMQPMLPPPLDQPGSPDGIYDGVKAGHHQPQPQIGHNCNLTIKQAARDSCLVRGDFGSVLAPET